MINKDLFYTLFASQISGANQSDGKYMGDTPYEEVVAAIMHNLNCSYDDAKKFVDARIKEYEDHIGQHRVYYFLETDAKDSDLTCLDMLAMWEDEFDGLCENYDFIENPRSNVAPPYAKPKTK